MRARDWRTSASCRLRSVISVPLTRYTGPLAIFGSGVQVHATSNSVPSRCSHLPSSWADAWLRTADRMQSRAAARSPSGTYRSQKKTPPVSWGSYPSVRSNARFVACGRTVPSGSIRQMRLGA